MGIFNEFFKKEKPVFTGSRFGFGSGGGGGVAAAAPTVTLSSGGTITQPGNGYAYHHFDGVGDIYSSSTVNDTNFSNYSLETRSVGDRGANGAAPTAHSFCIVLKSAQETVDVRSQNTGGSTSGVFSFWYSTDNGSTFSPHPSTHTGAMNGGTAVTIGPHSSPYGGVTHVVYSRGASGNRYYWAPTPVATFVPNGPRTIDIVMTAGGGAGGSSGGGAGGVVHYANKAVTTGTITLSIGKGGTGGAPGGAPGNPQIGNNSTLSGPDFPATITAAGGGGGGSFNVSPFPFAGGSGGGGYSTAGGNNQGPGGPGTQPGLNSTYTPLGPFNQYGNNGGAGSTKIGYVYGGGGGGAGAAGGALPSPTAPTPTYLGANGAVGGAGVAIPGFEYPLWSAADLTPYSPSNNHFGGGGGAGSSPFCPGGHGGGGNGGTDAPGPATAFGIPTLGGGAGGQGTGKGAGGSGGVIIRYSLT